MIVLLIYNRDKREGISAFWPNGIGSCDICGTELHSSEKNKA